MAKSKMPVSKAKTAYGLLSEIRKLILEEPKRYDQTAWKRTPFTIDKAPPCGTVCCVAGWVDTLKSPAPVPAERASECVPVAEDEDGDAVFDYRVRFNASCILGLSAAQADTLFDGDAAGPSHPGYTHAKRGAAHIAKFQKKYAKQLKAKKV